jgi:hypothetical protein
MDERRHAVRTRSLLAGKILLNGRRELASRARHDQIADLTVDKLEAHIAGRIGAVRNGDRDPTDILLAAAGASAFNAPCCRTAGAC